MFAFDQRGLTDSSLVYCTSRSGLLTIDLQQIRLYRFSGSKANGFRYGFVYILYLFEVS